MENTGLPVMVVLCLKCNSSSSGCPTALVSTHDGLYMQNNETASSVVSSLPVS